MPASVRPSPASQPSYRASLKTCDASVMVGVYRMLLAGFAEAPTLVNGVAQGNTAHSERVADQLALLSTSVRAHHEAEDRLLWARLESRAPSCAAHVHRLREQHSEIRAHREALDESLPHWRTTGRAAEAAPVLAALTALNAAFATHLVDEEKNIVPVIEAIITEKELEVFVDHGRSATPKSMAMIQLGAILAAQPDGGDAWLQTNVSGRTRLIWQSVGKRKYERYRAELVNNTGRRAER